MTIIVDQLIQKDKEHNRLRQVKICCRSRDQYNVDFISFFSTIFWLANPAFSCTMRKIYIGIRVNIITQVYQCTFSSFKVPEDGLFGQPNIVLKN